MSIHLMLKRAGVRSSDALICGAILASIQRDLKFTHRVAGYTQEDQSKQPTIKMLDLARVGQFWVTREGYVYNANVEEEGWFRLPLVVNGAYHDRAGVDAYKAPSIMHVMIEEFVEPPRPFTPEEAAENFLRVMHGMVVHWGGQHGSVPMNPQNDREKQLLKERLEGLMFSFLGVLGGSGSTQPPYLVVPFPTQEQVDEAVSRGENFYRLYNPETFPFDPLPRDLTDIYNELLDKKP